MSASHAGAVAVYIEAGKKRVFACALDWPGWCRAGRDEASALEALSGAASRYRAVAEYAGVPFPSQPSLDVVERVPGTGTTDFGAPDKPATADLGPLGADEAARIGGLLSSAWRFFDEVVARTPTVLRKGPRGGGRDRDPMVEHVLAAETAYGRKIGVRVRQPAIGDRLAISGMRDAIVARLRASAGPAGAKEWPLRYAARRIAWHVLDHAWEMEDKSAP